MENCCTPRNLFPLGVHISKPPLSSIKSIRNSLIDINGMRSVMMMMMMMMIIFTGDEECDDKGKEDIYGRIWK